MACAAAPEDHGGSPLRLHLINCPFTLDCACRIATPCSPRPMGGSLGVPAPDTVQAWVVLSLIGLRQTNEPLSLTLRERPTMFPAIRPIATLELGVTTSGIGTESSRTRPALHSPPPLPSKDHDNHPSLSVSYHRPFPFQTELPCLFAQIRPLYQTALLVIPPLEAMLRNTRHPIRRHHPSL